MKTYEVKTIHTAIVQADNKEDAVEQADNGNYTHENNETMVEEVWSKERS